MQVATILGNESMEFECSQGLIYLRDDMLFNRLGGWPILISHQKLAIASVHFC